MTADERERLLGAMVALAARGGDVVWSFFTGECAVTIKADESPVTAADQAAEKVILAGLGDAAPAIPVVAEEEAAAGRIPAVDGAFFLVDPLDGTKEFIKRGNDFTINIGLVEDGSPTMGVVYAPARDAIWWGDVTTGRAFAADRAPNGTQGAARALGVRAVADPLCAVASKSHNTPQTEAWLADAGVGARVSVGSSLKFVLVASGEADVYPRPAPTMEWDTCAGDAVLRAAGGRTVDLDGATLTYGKDRFFNPGFVATGPYDPAPLRPYLGSDNGKEAAQ